MRSSGPKYAVWRHLAEEKPNEEASGARPEAGARLEHFLNLVKFAFQLRAFIGQSGDAMYFGLQLFNLQMKWRLIAKLHVDGCLNVRHLLGKVLHLTISSSAESAVPADAALQVLPLPPAIFHKANVARAEAAPAFCSGAGGFIHAIVNHAVAADRIA
jgi:hypothetical protein